MQTITIATRRGRDYCPRTQIEYPVVDRMVRRGTRLFLIEESYRQGEREVVRPISLSYAYQWLRELPEQVKRNVIAGGLAA